VNGKGLNLGAWTTEKEAARAYDRAARFHLGAQAPLNFSDQVGTLADPSTPMADARRREQLDSRLREVGVLVLREQRCGRASGFLVISRPRSWRTNEGMGCRHEGETRES
jgi:hypothetical protein